MFLHILMVMFPILGFISCTETSKMNRNVVVPTSILHHSRSNLEAFIICKTHRECGRLSEKEDIIYKLHGEVKHPANGNIHTEIWKRGNQEHSMGINSGKI